MFDHRIAAHAQHANGSEHYPSAAAMLAGWVTPGTARGCGEPGPSAQENGCSKKKLDEVGDSDTLTIVVSSRGIADANKASSPRHAYFSLEAMRMTQWKTLSASTSVAIAILAGCGGDESYIPLASQDGDVPDQRSGLDGASGGQRPELC